MNECQGYIPSGKSNVAGREIPDLNETWLARGPGLQEGMRLGGPLGNLWRLWEILQIVLGIDPKRTHCLFFIGHSWGFYLREKK
jgi:hypothetical protein